MITKSVTKLIDADLVKTDRSERIDAGADRIAVDDRMDQHNRSHWVQADKASLE